MNPSPHASAYTPTIIQAFCAQSVRAATSKAHVTLTATASTPLDESAHLGQFIPLHYHHHMLGDDARTSAFKLALQLTVPQGGRVLEFGSGTGVLSYFAAQRASQVTAVEFNPALVHSSREFLAHNGVADIVSVVQADASQYLPDDPVDVVVCEMLHSALLREKQLAVIQAFKSRYGARFGALPRFVPEATLLGVQPLHQDYDYHGYNAAVPLFQDSASASPRSHEMAAPMCYATIDYQEAFPSAFEHTVRMTATHTGTINAVRFITQNLLAVLPQEGRSVDWNNQHLVLPLKLPVTVQAGTDVDIRFSYTAGHSIEALSASLQCERVD